MTEQHDLKQFLFDSVDRGIVVINDTCEGSARRWAKFVGLQITSLIEVKPITERD